MAARYGRWVGFLGDDEKQQIYSGDFQAQLNGAGSQDWLARLFDEAGELEAIDAAMSVDVQSYLPFDLLVKVDITSMANSLEARSPFLDQEVMEFAARLPVDLKLKGRQAKYLLKRAFPEMLPAENVSRRKMGFGVPVGQWFRSSLRGLLEDALLSEQAAKRPYFQAKEIHNLVSEHLERRADHSFKLWNLLMLELWHREFID